MERRLGRGGMADVYLAHDEELDRPVAVKVLASLGEDEEARQRFMREARLAARLGHPNVVTVYDVGEHEGAPCIVMEYVEGETLADLIARRGRLPADEVVRLAAQACAGLQHAHDAGLVHRDVKPQNLLVRADGTLKISDFGIARAAEGGTQVTTAGTILGTVGYLAPEQLTDGAVTPAADLYGLGAVLYEALTGRPPLKVLTLADLPRAHTQPIEPVRALAPETPPALEAVVMQALARRPEERPGSAAELARLLGEPLTHEPPTVRLRQARRPGRNVWVPIAVAAPAWAEINWSPENP
ncbi:MAG: serine/threonine-protein kinase, partial [Gaiellaceae bacterium]